MIQRIQSVYLFVVTVLWVIMWIYPVAMLDGNILGFGANFFYSAIIAILTIVSFGSIFLFKKRVLQMRVNSFCIALTAIAYIIYGICIYYIGRSSAIPTKIYFPVVIPPINIILTYLAIRAIGKDDALVRSLDRLR